MRPIRVFLSRLRALFGARARDRELEREIASHLDEAADEYVRQGLSPEEARRAARLSFGGIGGVQEAYRDARSFLSLEHLRRDVRHAARSLRRSPGFSVAVLAVLSIGTAALASVFALLHTIVLQPLPFAASDRLVAVRSSAPGLGVEEAGLSSSLYFHYLEQARSFDALAAYQERKQLNLQRPGEGTERVRVTSASAALFALLDVRPVVGRLFTEADGRPGFMNMTWQIPILLSHQFWVDRFGADPAIAGRVLRINDNPREVVGVLPEGFAFPSADTQIWMLVEPSKSSRSFSWSMSWNVIGRMRPGITVASAQAELTHVIRGLEGAFPDTTAEKMAEVRLAPLVTPLKTFLIGDVVPMMWLLFGGMAVLLLVAGANSAGLFLVRADHRAREMAVRRALGAHGPHLARLFVVEALLLTGAAAALGLLLARGVLSAVIAFIPIALPRTSEIRLGGIAMLFAAGLAVLMAAGYGALAVRRQRQALTAGFPGDGLWATRRRGLGGADLLLALQVALALTLMAGSALMVRTYRNLSLRELGFSAADVLTVEIGLPYRKAGQHVRIYEQVVDRLRRLPHVRDASAASFVPLTIGEHVFPIQSGETPMPFKFFVPGFFDTMGTRIVEGERLGAGDTVTTPRPVLVSAALARRLFPGERAVGRAIQRLEKDGSVVTLANGPVPPFTIAGVVADVREDTPRSGPTEIVYIPLMEPAVEQSINPTNMTFVLRATVPPLSLVAQVKSAIIAVDPDLSIGRIRTMDAIVGAARSREAFVGVLLLSAAIVSLVLGAIGIYASVAQVVRRRTREIGIRLALGAGRVEIVRMVTAGSLYVVLAGAALGLAVSLASTRWLGSLLFGVTSHDPIVFVTVTAGLVATAAAAALLAARHATGVTPLLALRGE